jgi:hypothetical protein
MFCYSSPWCRMVMCLAATKQTVVCVCIKPGFSNSVANPRWIGDYCYGRSTISKELFKFSLCLFTVFVDLSCQIISIEHRLRVFENRGLRIIFGPKRDEVAGELRKLHNEELHNLYSSSDIIRQVK